MTVYCIFILLATLSKICATVDLNVLSPVEKGLTGVLICYVSSFTATVEISNSRNPGVSLTSCNPAFCTPRSSGRYTYSSNSSAVSVTISSATQADDEATWTCTLNTIPHESDNFAIQISSRPATTELTENISSNGSNTDKVTLSATSYCFYPSISTVSLLYRIGTTGLFVTLSTSVPVSSHSGSRKGCDAYEFEIVVSGLEITPYKYPVLSHKSNVYLTLSFDHPVLGTFTPRNGPVGPYHFKGKNSVYMTATAKEYDIPEFMAS